MKTYNKIVALLLVVLGIIHDVATFTPLISKGLENLPKSKADALTYMSLMCGTSLILCGALLFVLMPLSAQNKTIKPATRIIGVFLAIAGCLAVLYMPHNPFALITLLLCVMACIGIGKGVK